MINLLAQVMQLDPDTVAWAMRGLFTAFFGLVTWVALDVRKQFRTNNKLVWREINAAKGELKEHGKTLTAHTVRIEHLSEHLADDVAARVASTIQGLPKTNYKR